MSTEISTTQEERVLLTEAQVFDRAYDPAAPRAMKRHLQEKLQIAHSLTAGSNPLIMEAVEKSRIAYILDRCGLHVMVTTRSGKVVEY